LPVSYAPLYGLYKKYAVEKQPDCALEMLPSWSLQEIMRRHFSISRADGPTLLVAIINACGGSGEGEKARNYLNEWENRSVL
jgi:hypothetical protein